MNQGCSGLRLKVLKILPLFADYVDVAEELLVRLDSTNPSGRVMRSNYHELVNMLDNSSALKE